MNPWSYGGEPEYNCDNCHQPWCQQGDVCKLLDEETIEEFVMQLNADPDGELTLDLIIQFWLEQDENE